MRGRKISYKISFSFLWLSLTDTHKTVAACKFRSLTFPSLEGERKWNQNLLLFGHQYKTLIFFIAARNLQKFRWKRLFWQWDLFCLHCHCFFLSSFCAFVYQVNFLLLFFGVPVDSIDGNRIFVFLILAPVEVNIVSYCTVDKFVVVLKKKKRGLVTHLIALNIHPILPGVEPSSAFGIWAFWPL